MSWQTTGSSQEWLPINRWRMDSLANVATFNTQSTIKPFKGYKRK
jgi:hypothetical protein